MPVNRLVSMLDRRARPEAAAVARIAVGIGALLKAFERAPVLERMGDPSVVRVPYLAGQPSVVDLPTVMVLALWIALAIAFTAGAATRLTGSALALLLLGVMFSDQQLYSNHLYLLVWLVGLLTMADAGRALSLDHRGRPREAVVVWPLWLLRLQVSVVYFFAGVSKVTALYLSGSVVALNLRRDGLLAIPDGWRTFELMAAASVISITVEVALAILLWLPRWRRTAFVVGFALHVGIAIWFVPTVPLIVFAIIALAPYVLFLDLQPRPLTLVFDDSCGFCTRWVQWFRRLDWLQFLDIVPGSDAVSLSRLGVPREDADRALQLLHSGRREQGFDAVVNVLEHLPLSFLWAPILRLWPVLQVGRRVYGLVAIRRQCSIDPRPQSVAPERPPQVRG